jgi:glycosyltransferase involved in cell wall biosynthesis
MTKLFNVTEALSVDSNHGITRTERMIASNFLDVEDVQFFAYIDHKFRLIENQVLRTFLETFHAKELIPKVEYFGSFPQDSNFTQSNLSSRAQKQLRLQFPDRIQRARRELSDRKLTTSIQVSEYVPLRPNANDVMLSVGLDWTYDYLGFAERQRYAHGTRVIGFCYDLIPIVHPQWLFPPDPIRFSNHFHRLDRVSDKVLCISEQTKKDYNSLFSENIDRSVRVVTLGSDLAARSEPKHDAFAKTLFDGEDYVLYVATIDRRKNHELLYRAIKILQARSKRLNILFVGKVGSGVSDLLRCLRTDTSLDGTVAHLTNCDDGHLSAVYKRCSFAVYPSLYEGWGLGVTEALAHGKHCVVANTSSLPEAGLGACTELNPFDAKAWADTLEQLTVDRPPTPDVAIPTWRDTAESLLAEMEF